MPKLSALQFVGFGKEATWGTASAAVKYMPITSFKVEDEIKKVVDEGRRANLSKDFAVLYGPRESKFDLSSYLYPNEFGILAASLLGAPTTTGASAPYTHTFKLANVMPPSLTFNDFNGINTRQYLGALVEEITLKFDEEKAVDVSVKGQAKPSAVIATPTPTFSTVDPIMGVLTTFKLGGVANVNLVGATVNLKREVKMLHGADGTQNPTKAAVGRLECTGKLTFDIEDEAEYLVFAGQTTTALEFVFGSGNNMAKLTMTKVDFSKANVDRSQEWVRVDADFRAVYNVTDAGPVQIVLSNTTATY